MQPYNQSQIGILQIAHMIHSVIHILTTPLGMDELHKITHDRNYIEMETKQFAYLHI